MFKSFVKTLLAKRKGVDISLKSNVAFNTIPSIGEGSKISEGVSCSENISIGRFTSITGPNTKLTAKINSIKIGNFCSIAPGVLIQEYGHRYNRATSYYINRNCFGKDLSDDIYSKGSIIVEDDVWIGANSVILSGVYIGRGAIIAAGSIVTKDVSRYTIVGGNPARFIKNRFSNNEVVDYLEETKWWTWGKDKLRKNKKLFLFSEEQLIGKIRK